jgi:hypothetical protein
MGTQILTEQCVKAHILVASLGYAMWVTLKRLLDRNHFDLCRTVAAICHRRTVAAICHRRTVAAICDRRTVPAIGACPGPAGDRRAFVEPGAARGKLRSTPQLRSGALPEFLNLHDAGPRESRGRRRAALQ